ncbi:MAG: DUF1338 domain-containing protein [Myxococcales bacterium]|nr:DUF1338 domain-containing protein [Myxococcales bacterium]
MTAARLDELFARLWADYVAINPQAAAIHALLRGRGEVVVNDHIALRTFAGPELGLEVLARGFVDLGYVAAGDYTFPRKKLRARHYLHADPRCPKVFISELEVDRGSPALAAIVGDLVAQAAATPGLRERWDLAAAGRPWAPVSRATYDALAAESEYAAWLAAFGLRANHFTISVNHLRTVDSLAALCELIEGAGIPLSAAGGLIKGSPADLLEQASTIAAPTEVRFADGPSTIPGCYYEFARRYADADGRLFTGFIAGSADRLFESTDRRGG